MKCSSFKMGRFMILMPLFFFFCFQFSCQDKKVDNKNSNDDKLQQEVLSAVKTSEEEGTKSIAGVPGSDANEKKEKKTKISIFMTEVGKDKSADAYYSAANHYYSLSRYDIALGLHEKALQLYQQSGDLVGQGDVYHSKGEIFFTLVKNKDAEAMFNKALLLYSKGNNLLGQGNALKSMGDIFLRTGEYQKAHDMYRKALSCYVNAKSLLGQGNAYQGEGEAYKMEENYTTALEKYKKALEFYIKENSALGQGNIYSGFADLYRRTGEIENALKTYHKALDFYRKTDDKFGPSAVFSDLGDIYLKIGEIDMAKEVCEKALKGFEKIDSHLQKGNSYNIQGDIFSMTGSKGKALEMYEKALNSYEKANSPISLGNVYKSKGDIYLWVWNFPKALEMYKKAVYFYVKINDWIGQGNVANSIGNILMMAGKSKKALELYNQALIFHKKANNVIGMEGAYIDIADVKLDEGDYKNALRGYDKAMLYQSKINSLHGKGIIYYRKGYTYLKMGDKKHAMKMLEKSREIFSRIKLTQGEAFALFWIAKVNHMLDKDEKALELYENGIKLLEKVRKQTIFSELKMSFMESSYDIYEEAIHFMLENKYDKWAFRVAELMRARVFLERLAEGIESVDKGLDQGLRQKRDNLVSRLSVLKRKIAYETGGNEKELKKELNQTEIQLDNLDVEIQQKYPKYAFLNRKPVELKELQQKVLKKDELLLEYFASKKGVYLFLVSRENFKVKKLKASIETIDESFDKYLKFILNSSSQKRKSFGIEKEMIKNLENLYSFLIKPVEKEIDGKELIFAPDAPLAGIPFEVLISSGDKKVGKPVFLIEMYPVKYIQSASVLAIFRSQGKGEVVNENLVAFGDPVYDSEEANHRRLPETREEVEAIAKVFQEKGHRPVVYLRSNASEKNAKSSAMNRFGYIHFACHGISRFVGQGIFSVGFQSLVLSRDTDEEEDGYLTLNEIMNCDYNAQLVVLSGCKTNVGKIARGEGVIGLTRAAMFAGTPAAVATLWEVRDNSAKKLMVQFYKNLLENRMEKSEALRKAKLELLKTGNYSSPQYWSAFVMYGE
ncbi:MAG: CHAT domain-containing protein [Candidatus Aminicenantes bacterium]